MPAVVQALLTENESTSPSSGTVDSAALDSAFGSVIGSLLRRGITEWELVLPGDEEDVLTMVPFGSPAVLLPDWATPATGWTHSSTAPVAPIEGQKWVDDDTGIEYTYVNDGNSSQWVEF